MNLLIFSFLFASFFSCFNGEVIPSEKKIICYFNSIAKYRRNNTQFTIDNVPEFCTHIIYSFTEYNRSSGLAPLDKNGDVISFEGFPSLTKLIHPKTKVIFSIPEFWQIYRIGDPHETTTWIKNMIEILRKYRYDGVEIGVQNYELEIGNESFDGKEFIHFVKIFQELLKKDAEESGKPRMLLSVLLPEECYSQIREDWTKLDLFDWMGVLEHVRIPPKVPTLNHISPLFSQNGPSVNQTISHFLKYGLPSKKLALALPLFGKSYQLTSPDQFQLGLEAKGPGKPGPYTLRDGFMAYFEICRKIKDENWRVVSENTNDGAFAFMGDQWVSFDNVEIIKRKVQFSAGNNLGGIMLLALDFDDFMGYCGEGDFPLSRIAVKTFLKAS